MGLVDDPAKISRKQRLFTEELLQVIRQRLEQRALGPAVHGDEIGCHAGLACVQELPPRDALGGLADVGSRPDDGGVFATELQRDRGQVAGSRSHYQAPDPSSASEENVVPTLL